MPLGTEVGLGPGNIVLDGDPALPTERSTTAPTFWPLSVVAKWSSISATTELVFFAMYSRQVDERTSQITYYLWPPCIAGSGHICFHPVVSLYLSFFSSPNLSGHRLDVYHTSTHGVALVRI